MDIPSLFMIPSAVSSGKVHSVFPNSTDADFDFNRDSDATRVNSEGLIERVGYYGSELVTNGSFNADTNWSKDGWKIENGKAINTLASSGLNLYQGSVTSVGNTFKVVLDAVISAGGVKVLLGGGSGGYNEIGQASSTGTHTFVGVSNGADNRILIQTLSGSTIGSVIVDNVSVKQINGDRARLNYEIEGGLVNTKPSLLLEPQRTNTAEYSEDAAVYTYNDSTITENVQIITPYGYKSQAVKISAEFNEPYPIRAASFNLGSYSTNDVVTLSGFVKYNGYRYVQFGGYFGSESSRFDLINGVIIQNQSNVISSSMVKFPNDWYKLTVTYTFQNTIGNGYLYAGWVLSFNSSFAYTNARSGGIYAWGLQAELGSYATSYIPTNGSTQTRAAETCNGAGTSSILPTQGILFTEVKVQQTGSTNGIIFISNGTTSNFLMLRYAPSHKFQVEATGGVNIIEDSARASGRYKVAVKYSSAGVEMWIDGSKAKETSTATTATGINELGVGSSPYGNIVGCNVFDARIYNTKEMTDSEVDILLTKITS